MNLTADEPDGPTCVPTIHGCPYCEQTFETLALYHRHLAKRHKALPLFQQFVNLRDAYLGKPQCAHCLGKFAQWVGLIHHIEFDSCPNFNVHRALQVPPCDNEDLRHYVRTQSWDALFERPDLMNWIRQHCVICARAFQTGKDVLRHLARCHYSMWEEPMTKMSEIVIQINNTKACLACGIDKAAWVAVATPYDRWQ